MAYWALIILIIFATIGVGASALANRRAQIQKEREKLFNQSKAYLLQLEPIIDKLLRINCRHDIIECLIRYYSYNVQNMARVFPALPEVAAFQQIEQQLPLREPSSLDENPLTDASELAQVQTYIRQVIQLFSILRSHNLTTPTLSDSWSKYLKSLSIEIEIKAYMGQAEKLLAEGNRSKSSNSLRTAQSKLKKASGIDKELKKELHDDIAERIRLMYGLKGHKEEGDEHDGEHAPP